MKISSIKVLLFKPVVIYLLADVLVKSMQFLLMPSASHLLSVNEYGRLTLFLSLLTALVPVVSLSSESAYSIFYNQDAGKDKKKLFIVSIHVAATGYLLLTLITLILSMFNDNLIFSIISLKSQVTKMLLIVFFEYFVNLYLLSSRLSFDKFKYFFWFILYFSLKFLIGLGAIYFFESSDAYLNSLLILNSLFAVVILSRFFILTSFFTDILKVDKKLYVRLLKYSMMILPVTLFAVINSMVDKAYITSLLSVEDLANYTSIFLLAGSMQIVILAMNKAYMPELLNIYSKHGYDALMIINHNTRKLMVANYFIFVSCITILPLVFNIIFSERIEFSYDVFLVLSLSFLFNTVYILLTNVLSLEERTAKYKMFGFLIAALINILLSYFFTLEFGILGAAISTLLSCFIASFILFLLVNFKVKRNYLLKETLIFIFISTITAMLMLYLDDIFYM